MGAGIACTKTGTPSRCASAKKGRNRSSPIDTPSTLEAISTPYSPMSRIVVSSAAAISGSCIGTIPKPNSRSGTAAHRAAMDSLT